MPTSISRANKRKREDECVGAETQPKRTAAHDELVTSLKDHYATGRFSDFTVTCGERTYKVHKVVLARSPFFDAIFRGNFKEAADGLVDLPEDDPLIVDLMMEYLYTLDYKHPGSPEELEDTELVLHAKVYALAEKYMLNGLKDIAKQKFLARFDLGVTIPHLVAAMREVYTSTVDTDRGLRDAILEGFGHHETHLNMLLDHEIVVQSMKDVKDFAHELLMWRHQKYKEQELAVKKAEEAEVRVRPRAQVRSQNRPRVPNNRPRPRPDGLSDSDSDSISLSDSDSDRDSASESDSSSDSE